MYKYTKYTIEDNKNLSEKLITVAVNQKEITKSVQKAVETIKGTAKIKGFGPGNAPTDIVANLYNEEILQESSRDLFNDLLKQILAKEKIIPVAPTNVEFADEEKKN